LASIESDTKPNAGPTPAQALQATLLARPATEARHMADAIRALAIDAVEAAEQAFVELPEGCACCLRNPDLVAAMESLSARGDLDRVGAGLGDDLAARNGDHRLCSGHPSGRSRGPTL
jgi:hypothetical protein